PKASRSYPEILQLNQELFKNLQGLIDEDEARKKDLLATKNAYEMAQAEIARLERELRQSIEREADRAEELSQLEQERVDQLGAMSAQLDELQNAQLQWAMDRQALLEQHESLKKGQASLQQTHDRAQVDLGRVKDELARAKARDGEHAMERQALLDQHESLKQGHLDLQQGHDRA